MNVYQKYKDAQGRKTGPWFMKYPIGRDPLTGKIKYKIEKVGDFKKLAERAYQKKMVEWAEKKYLDIKEESKLTFSQLVMWFLELPVVRQNKTIKHIERACRDLENGLRIGIGQGDQTSHGGEVSAPAATGTNLVR